MKKTTISFNDDYMLQGAKDYVKEKGMTLSEYVTSVVGEDLKKHKLYKISAVYENGETSEETDFYTYPDFMESVRAYAQIFSKRQSCADSGTITSYEYSIDGEVIGKESI